MASKVENTIVRAEESNLKIVTRQTIQKVNATVSNDTIIAKVQTTEIKPVITIQEVRPSITQEVTRVTLSPVQRTSSGSSTDVSFEAGETLGGQRAVIIDNAKAYYADNTNLSHLKKPIGISTAAAVSGASINIRFFGELQDSSFSFEIDKPIFVSTNGMLTQTAPSNGFSLIIATAETSKKIFINKEQSFILT